MPMILDLEEGRLLVASDLQGNWQDYQLIRQRFHGLKSDGLVDILVFDGDLIHSMDSTPDDSKRILDDLIDHPSLDVIPVLGNHELMHIYDMQVQKRGVELVVPLEIRIRENRRKYMEFFMQMPYAIRTQGGVVINHTGPNRAMAGRRFGLLFDSEEPELVDDGKPFEWMENLNHSSLRQKALTLANMHVWPGESKLEDDLSCYQPEIGRAFLQLKEGQYIWEVFFNANEWESRHQDQYPETLERFLKAMSHGTNEMKFLVSAHKPVPEGHCVIAEKQLRICSSYGAQEKQKRLVIVDAKKEYRSMRELVASIVPLHP